MVLTLGAHIEVRVNIGCCLHVAVTHPHLNDLHIVIVSEEQGCAGVAQIVKADLAHSVFVEKVRKVCSHVIGLDQIAHSVATYHIQVLCGVGILELLTVEFLSCLMPFQRFHHHGNHGDGTP